jgi:hypothetical protein
VIVPRLSRIAAALVALAALPAAATDWLVVSGYSHHFKDREDFRAANPGLGWERPTDAWGGSWMAGYYRNSYDRDTVYAGLRWEPLRWGPARLGVFAGLASGYWTPVVALPMLCIEAGRVGINLVAAPTIGEYVGYVGAQLKFRID